MGSWARSAGALGVCSLAGVRPKWPWRTHWARRRARACAVGREGYSCRVSMLATRTRTARAPRSMARLCRRLEEKNYTRSPLPLIMTDDPCGTHVECSSHSTSQQARSRVRGLCPECLAVCMSGVCARPRAQTRAREQRDGTATTVDSSTPGWPSTSDLRMRRTQMTIGKMRPPDK